MKYLIKSNLIKYASGMQDSEYCFAEYMLPEKLVSEFIDEYKLFTGESIYSFIDELIDEGRDNDARLIQMWLSQDGWKVACADNNLFVLDDVVYHFLNKSNKITSNIDKKSDTFEPVSPSWINDTDWESLDPEGSYQIRQFPFLMPSSRGLNYWVDLESPEEKLYEVKWASSDEKDDEQTDILDWHTQSPMKPGEVFLDEMSQSGAGEQKGVSWFQYKDIPVSSIPVVFQALKALKEGRIKHIDASSGSYPSFGTYTGSKGTFPTNSSNPGSYPEQGNYGTHASLDVQAGHFDKYKYTRDAKIFDTLVDKITDFAIQVWKKKTIDEDALTLKVLDLQANLSKQSLAVKIIIGNYYYDLLTGKDTVPPEQLELGLR